jgi:hypothetical protein
VTLYQDAFFPLLSCIAQLLTEGPSLTGCSSRIWGCGGDEASLVPACGPVGKTSTCNMWSVEQTSVQINTPISSNQRNSSSKVICSFTCIHWAGENWKARNYQALASKGVGDGKSMFCWVFGWCST